MPGFNSVSVPIHEISSAILSNADIRLFVKREDLIHPHISGNKWRKLKYNIKEAKWLSKKVLLTFGGAYSNHIAAVAAAGDEFGFKTIGIIRGEPYSPLNPTLQFSVDRGMKLDYLNRTKYRTLKTDHRFLANLSTKFGSLYVIPEGGANKQGVKGCMEILDDIEFPFDYVCCACGTGTTLTGLALSLKYDQKALGFASLKGASFMKRNVAKNIHAFRNSSIDRWEIIHDYHFGGYAKINPELKRFVQNFKTTFQIELDLVYTGKMMYGIFDLVEKGFFRKGSTIIAVHTGGIQGNQGFGFQF